LKSTPVIAREQAQWDVNEAIDYDLGEAALASASGFIEALEQATFPPGCSLPI
jgi:hypothetical protein